MDLVDKCDHLSVIEDDRTSDVVCTDCGVVVDTFLQVSHNKQVKKNLLPEEKLRVMKLRFLCSLLYIEAENVIQKAFRISECLERDYKVSTRDEQYMYAFSIWETLNCIGSPRARHEIERICAVEPCSMLRFQNKYGIPETFCRVEKYVDRVCHSLRLPFQFSKYVRELAIVYGFEGYYQPHNVLAACIMLVGRFYRRMNFITKFYTEITWDFICNQLLVNKSAVALVMRKIGHRNAMRLLSNI